MLSFFLCGSHAVMGTHFRSGNSHWMCAGFDCTVCDPAAWKQLGRQEPLFAWWLISDQQTRSRWGNHSWFLWFFLSTLKYSTSIQLFFCSFIFLTLILFFFFNSSFEKNPTGLAHTSRTLFHPKPFFHVPLTQHCFLLNSVRPISFAFPHFHHCLSLPPPFPPSSPALVLWKGALSAGLNGAGPLEARTMGPSSEGQQSPWKRNKDPQPKRGPTLHLTPPQRLALLTVCVCVWVLGKKNDVCVLACIRRQVLPLGISALWICPAKKPWLSAIIPKPSAFSCWHSASIILRISAWPPVHSHHCAPCTRVC